MCIGFRAKGANGRKIDINLFRALNQEFVRFKISFVGNDGRESGWSCGTLPGGFTSRHCGHATPAESANSADPTADQLFTESSMAWFFSSEPSGVSRRVRPSSTPITRKRTDLQLDPLEVRLLPSGNVWLPQQLQPVDGAQQYNQSFQVFRPADGNIMPDLGMNTGTVAFTANFSLTQAGIYSVSLAASGPIHQDNSYVFTESGTITFSLTELGTASLGHFGVGSITSIQTASLDWTFTEKNQSGDTVSYSSGHETFTLTGTPSAPFDGLFAAGFNWLDPTWHVSSANNLDLPNLSASTWSVNANGTETYDFELLSGLLTLSGNATHPLYDSIGQDGQESYSVALGESITHANQGSDTFTLSETGSYSPSAGFTFANVSYHEQGDSAPTLTMTATLTALGTGVASGQQTSAAN